MLHICIERSVEAQFNRNTCILCLLHLLLTCLNSSQPCHLNFAAKRINVQCFFKKDLNYIACSIVLLKRLSEFLKQLILFLQDV